MKLRKIVFSTVTMIMVLAITTSGVNGNSHTIDYKKADRAERTVGRSEGTADCNWVEVEEETDRKTEILVFQLRGKKVNIKSKGNKLFISDSLLPQNSFSPVLAHNYNEWGDEPEDEDYLKKVGKKWWYVEIPSHLPHLLRFNIKRGSDWIDPNQAVFNPFTRGGVMVYPHSDGRPSFLWYETRD